MPRSSLLLLLALEFASGKLTSFSGLRVNVQRAEGRDRRTPDVDVKSESNRYLTLRVDKNDGTNMWLLDLEESSKDFLSSRFVTRHFDASNTEFLTREYPACHYRGRLRDVPNSHVVISTCGGTNGIIHDGKRTYIIEPDSDGVESSHLLSESASDEIISYCGVTHPSLPSKSSLKPPHQHHHYVAKRSPIYPNTVELTFVADIDLYKNVKENVTELQTILLRFANVISAIYKRSDQGVRVVLIAIEVWSNGNRATVLSDFKTTLRNFVAYNGDTLQKDPLFKSDNTQLLTGIDFTGSTKGYANVKTICQGRTSAAVVEVYSLIGADVAGIMAHEMGHNFGMQHDEDIVSCPCSDPDGCVMSAVLSGERNFTFSECSRATLKQTLDEGQGSCLTNLPEKIEGPVVCGNGFVESDEECDCGTVEECAQANDTCCNPRTCTLNAGAVCSDSDDVCCENCQFSAVGMLCRSANGDCDLEEVCTGVSARCPTNLYKYDGMNCTGVNDTGICYRGVCNTRTAQCQGFWGPDAVTGSSRCYRANLVGQFYGHCGGNATDGYIPCEEANVMCGKLQCLSPLVRPTVSRAWRSATYRTGSETCRSVSVTVEDDERDPGLVGDGTACGNGMVCILNKCVDVPTGSAQCPRDDAGQLCSNNGICSSAGTCVCSDGFTSDDCSRKSDVPIASAQCPRDDAGHVCSNNGICSSAGTCVCSDSFTSDDCSRKSDVPTASVQCPQDDARHVCSSNGICSSAGTCICSVGFELDDCSRKSGQQLPDVPTTSVPCPEDDAGRLCSNNGICSSAGTCVCSDGFTSDDCSRHSGGSGGSGSAGVVAGVVMTLVLLL